MSTDIIDRLEGDMKVAMKAREADRLEAMRFLISEIRKAGINEHREPTDDDALVVIGRLIKQRQESIELFKKGDRDDLVAKEELGVELYRTYLPQQLNAEELSKIVAEVIAETSPAGLKDLGKVMKALLPRVKGRADGKVVNAVVREQLQEA
ncbi:GatB/YqeY domain-containing protein [Candidatus Nitronereus thalassa]|uniref:GatB/YqeY domain-containing protein n=1 Tax=Candidatus Nitronereus thalassa TaxID=3020898 RepID=A0ABU3K3W5_9BACT|nr:GatB/YqeY domain-containing protein [Candidatus Nitronereus thalassa]MDT7041084.1 GatB/YqeY domain-containing protein [Candidatus Nitronereus thalassa]